MNTIKTTIHYYDFDTREPDQKAKWEELRAKLVELVPHPMRAFEGSDGWDAIHIKPLDGQTVELETKHLFDNQWNTAATATSDKGLRVFDWHDIVPFPRNNQNRRQGHWLELTPEINEMRRNRNACGYCGHQEEAQRGAVFCGQCLGSEYLEKGNLYLLRMRPVSDGMKARPPLTDAELAHILPLYVAEQTGKGSERSKLAHEKRKAAIEADYDNTVRKATMRRDGQRWLLANGLKDDNVIYYDHTGVWCWGWRHKLSEEELAAVLAVISEFPFPYELIRANGPKLSGNIG